MKNDFLIRQKVAEGWRCDPRTGIVTRPDGSIHVKTSRPTDRYVTIELWGRRNGKRVKKDVCWSRFVCWLAKGEPPHPGYVADHLDGNILNNHPDNLDWKTKSENALNTSDDVKRRWKEMGREMALTRMMDPNGPDKLSFDLADEIRMKFHIEGGMMKSLASEYGVHPQTISDVVYFRSWVRPEPDVTVAAAIPSATQPAA